MALKGYKLYEIVSITSSHPFTSLAFIFFIFISKNFSLIEFGLSSIFISVISIIPTILWSIKRKKSIFLENRKERIPLLLLTSIIFLTGAIIGKVFDMEIFYIISMLYAVNTFALFIVNFKIKASIHISGITGPVTYLTLSIAPVFSLLYLFLFPVALARIKMKAHTTKEIIAGFLTSFLVTLSFVYLL